MALLASGLADLVADEEDLARFLTSSSQHKADAAKPAAFLPNPEDRETSVFRHGSQPIAGLWRLGREHALGQRTLHGAAIVKARHVRDAELEIAASEPPPRHAAIVGWPWIADDPDLQKARQKERAALLCQRAQLLLV
jgi:hypothetical protein